MHTCRAVGVPGRSSVVSCMRGRLNTASSTLSLFTGLQSQTHKRVAQHSWHV